MNLKIQIISLLFSFFYGVTFSFLVNINYELLFKKRKKYRIIYTLIFVLIMALLYFFLLQRINNGIMHVYFLMIILIGFYISFPITKKIRIKNVKKK